MFNGATSRPALKSQCRQRVLATGNAQPCCMVCAVIMAAYPGKLILTDHCQSSGILHTPPPGRTDRSSFLELYIAHIQLDCVVHRAGRLSTSTKQLVAYLATRYLAQTNEGVGAILSNDQVNEKHELPRIALTPKRCQSIGGHCPPIYFLQSNLAQSHQWSFDHDSFTPVDICSHRQSFATSWFCLQIL